ncbi:arrestin domain-containing protein 17 [Stomoxys calcitrans]|uniref:arrestin domain-containing protein 17 n=1 Tax=Stomoxys calcitrans TaxID=35570 RepID=UPI0027E3131D|nr:arrestin domain-containing protein 17 [Stomoxys calcitrans]
MAANCVISFDQNEYGTYFTGQLLTGKVVINLNKSKKFKGIKLKICGYAQCQWRERHGRKKPIYKSNLKRKHVYHGHEDYIASTTYLVGSEDSSPFAIEAGTHTYTFSCPIPVNCPSSFEGAYGHVRYVVKVITIRPGSSNRTYTKGFTVLKMMDLNRESSLLKSPAYNEGMENFCFFTSQTVHLRVDITQTGYVPGQMILVSSHVKNDTSVDVKKIFICLNLRATYTSDTPCMRTSDEKLCLVKKYCGSVPRHSERDYAEVIRVPATPPTCEHLSKVVRISYEICVVAVMNHLMHNPKSVIPITIGNVPLLMPSAPVETPSIDDVPTTSACAMQRAENIDHSMLSEETEVDFELPPPSYEEAMFMTTNLADDDVNTVSEQVQFTPRYPVYDVDEMAVNGVPPNPPLKKKKRKKKINQLQTVQEMEKEKPPRESPVEI